MIAIAGEVRLEIDNVIARMIISNPKRKNAISQSMWDMMFQYSEELKTKEDIRVLVICGEDGNFASGADLSEKLNNDGSAKNTGKRAHLAMKAVEELPFPVIAVIEGYALGGGCILAAHCDMRISSDDAIFSIPSAKRGIGIPRSIVEKMVRLIGPAFTMEMIFMGEYISAYKALSWGLVNDVVPTKELDDYVNGILDVLANNAPLSIKATKQNVKSIWNEQAREGDDPAKLCLHSKDIEEGVRGF